MKTVTIRREIEFPSFGAWKWSKADHEKPLSFQLRVARAFIYLEEDRYLKRERIVFPEGRIEFVYDPVPERLIEGLKSKGNAAIAVAEDIYDAYVEANRKLEALLYSVGQVRNLFPSRPCSKRDFFTESSTIRGRGVEWKVDDEPFQRFAPKFAKPRGRNPLFKAGQLITPSRWAALQKSADAREFPEDEVLELYRIRSKAAWQEVKVAAIEASIISESLLRVYALESLRKNNFSNSKIKRLKDELTFNNLLNILLPLSLSKTELRNIQPHIDSVDGLRGIRNDLVHGKIQEKDVDRILVEKGIDSAIRLVGFLRNKIRPSVSSL